MIVYIPTPITSAEQAEQLPKGSLVRDVRSGFEYRARHALGGYLQADLDAGVVVEALVPVEAEEETIPNAWFSDARAPHLARRLVTPWSPM